MDTTETQAASVELPIGAEAIQKKIRYSGVELLRILAIFLICINHAVQTSQLFIDFDNVLSVGTAFLKIMRCSGQIGNILFVICSSYFLLDSKRTKGEKALNLILDSLCISIIILICFLIGGYKFTAFEILKQFVPELWFIPVYVVFYAIHPMLNGALDKLNQKAHFTFICIVAVWGFIEMFINVSIGIFNNFISFIIVYFVVAYMKKYMGNYCASVKKNVIVFCIFFVVFVACVVANWALGMKIDYFKTSVILDGYYSPLLLPALLSLFNLFNSMKFKNKVINYFASCSLFVYCFHENLLLRSIIRPLFYKFVFGINPDLYLLWVVICGVGMFLGSYLVSVVYKETVHRLTALVSDKLCGLLSKIIGFLFAKTNRNKNEAEDDSVVL